MFGIEPTIWQFGITCIFNEHSATFLNISEMSKYSENFKTHRFALYAEMVRDRVKRTEIWDHTYWQWLKHIIFNHSKLIFRKFKKNINFSLSKKQLWDGAKWTKFSAENVYNRND